MIQLYSSTTSPFVRRVRVVLMEKGLKFEPIEGAQASPDYGKINPSLKIPYLIDGDTELFESNLIVDYLLRTYPGIAAPAENPPLAGSLTRPEHHSRDAQVLAAIDFLSDGLVIVRQMETLDGIKPDASKYVKRMIGRAQLTLDWLESEAEESGFAPGVFSVMDLNLCCMVGWIEFRDLIPWQGRPNLEAIVERYASRPSVAGTVPVE